MPWLFVEMFVELLYQRAMPLPWADSPAEEEAGGGGASREGTSMGVSWGVSALPGAGGESFLV